MKTINVYYSYTNKDKDIIDIAAVNETDILLGISEEDGITAAIKLNEQEQNDLISGILERRGIPTSSVMWTKDKEVWPGGISATGNTQSTIHPAVTE